MAAKKPLVISSTTNEPGQMQTGDFVDIPQGGTGATTAAAALTNLGGVNAAGVLSTVLSSMPTPTDNTVTTTSTVAEAFSYLQGQFNEIYNTVYATGLGVAQGGTGVTTLAIGEILAGNGTNPVTAATGAQIVTAIGSTAVANATNATTVTATNEIANTSYPIIFGSSTTTGPQTLGVDTGFTYNPSTNTLSLPAGGALNGNATSATSVTGTVAIANGGTGQTTTAAALTALGGISTTQLGAASGVATLNASGQLTASQIPSSLLGAMEFQSVWNASTNSPALTSSTGTNGQFYIVSVAGTTSLNGEAVWAVGDFVVFDNAQWNRIAGASMQVATVCGLTGTVTAAQIAAALSGLNFNITGTAANVTGVVAVANGGTGQTTATAALTALGGVNQAGVLSTPLTGLPAATNTSVTATATVLQAFADLQGQMNAVFANLFSPAVPIAYGGTGATTAAAGLAALGGLSSLNPVMTGQIGAVLPSGATSARPGTGIDGLLRYNTTIGGTEGFGPNGYVMHDNVVTAKYRGNVAVTSGTSQIPFGNSAPLSTGGTAVWSQAVTPNYTNSTMEIEFAGLIDSSVSGSEVTVAIFAGTTLLGFTVVSIATTNKPQPFCLNVNTVPGGSSAITYSCRIGLSAAGTWYLGRAATATMGGTNSSGWTITEAF